MTRSWYTDLLTMAKTDPDAAAYLYRLQKAETDEQKDEAKNAAREYVQSKTSDTTEAGEVVETTPVESVETPELVDIPAPDVTPAQDGSDAAKLIFDMSALAFNPRLAKMGINREEELFLKNVYVRKLSHEDKILMRRSIYNKKHAYMDGKQKQFKKQRAEAMEKAAKDPAVIKYHNQRKYVDKIIEALRTHRNFTWMFTNIEGLTPKVMKELLKNQGNINLFRAEYPAFVDKFKKKYGA